MYTVVLKRGQFNGNRHLGGFSTLPNKTIKYCFVRGGAVSRSDPARKVERNHAFAKSRIIQDSEAKQSIIQRFCVLTKGFFWITTSLTLFAPRNDVQPVIAND